MLSLGTQTDSLTDTELLAQFASRRCEDALRTLIERHLGLVYTAALRQVRDPGAAQDIAQAVFIALVQKAKSLQADGKTLTAWLLVAAHYGASKELRRRRRRARCQEKAIAMQNKSSPVVDSEALGSMLDEALNRLKPPDRAAIALYYLENRSLRDVGNVLEVSEHAAQKRVSRALQKLRKVLQRRGIHCSDDALQTSLHGCASVAISTAFLVDVLNTSLHPATATTGGSVVAGHIVKSLALKKATALAIAAMVMTAVAAPAIALVYHALFIGRNITSPIFTSRADAGSNNVSPAALIIPPPYLAIDLTPKGFNQSEADGISGNQIVGSVWDDGQSKNSQAMLWIDGTDKIVKLNPAGFTACSAFATDGVQQVGWGAGQATEGNAHALLWNSSPTNYVDINPPGVSSSRALSIDGNQQVGWGNGLATDGKPHALLWSGSAASYVDLNPAGFVSSEALCTDGHQEVGYGFPIGDKNTHALLWNGSASTAVDLNPKGFIASEADGVWNGKQVGWGEDASSQYHALIWSGTAESYIDLNPPGGNTFAGFTNSNQQVGSGNIHFGIHARVNLQALAWNNSAESIIYLHDYLAFGFISSMARSVNAAGEIVGLAAFQNFYIYNGPVLQTRAIEWVPTNMANAAIKTANENFIQTGNRNNSAHQEQDIVSECMSYAAKGNGQFPQNLGELLANGTLIPEQLVDPVLHTTPLVIPAEHAKDAAWINAHLAGHCDFVYLGAGFNFEHLTAKMAPTTILLYEQLPSNEGGSFNIVDANTHVRWVSAKEFLQITAWPTSP